MEKKYYIAVDGSPQGPFTPEELQKQGLYSDTRVFAKGWTKFRLASEVEELADFITASSSDNNSASSADKELLERLLAQLEDQQNEIKQLKDELQKINSSEKSQDESAVPPAFVPPATGETVSLGEEEAPKQEPQKKDNNGCTVAIIILLVVFLIIGLIFTFYHASKSNDSFEHDSEAYATDTTCLPTEEIVMEDIPVEDEEATEAVPAAEAAAIEAPAKTTSHVATTPSYYPAYPDYSYDYYDEEDDELEEAAADPDYYYDYEGNVHYY